MSLLCNLRQKIEEQFYTRKAKQRVLKARREGRMPVYVHTMGKVGSSTVRKSLRTSSIADSLAVYGTYFLSEDGLKFLHLLEHDGFGGWCNYTKSVKYLLREGLVLSEEIKRAVSNGERVKVVTLVRDPVSTNISGFFQNYRWWPEAIRKQCEANDANCVNELIKLFFERYPHDVPLTWWNNELKDVFHVDITRSDFPQDLGYKIYNSDIADVLVVKLEQLNNCVIAAIKEFMGVDDFQMISKNTSTDKWFADIYKEFCNTIVFPEGYLARMYQSIYYKTFYNNSELSSFDRKWRR